MHYVNNTSQDIITLVIWYFWELQQVSNDPKRRYIWCPYTLSFIINWFNGKNTSLAWFRLYWYAFFCISNLLLAFLLCCSQPLNVSPSCFPALKLILPALYQFSVYIYLLLLNYWDTTHKQIEAKKWNSCKGHIPKKYCLAWCYDKRNLIWIRLKIRIELWRLHWPWDVFAVF